MSDWQLIETAPKDGTPIRVTRRRGQRPFEPDNEAWTFCWHATLGCWMQKVGKDWHRQFFEPTHWKPLEAEADAREPQG